MLIVVIASRRLLGKDNNEIALNNLPLIGYHQLKVRNLAVSQAMRQITSAHAQEFIADPSRILQFTGGDAVLAAAIQGMMQQVFITDPKTPETTWSFNHYTQQHSTIKVADALRSAADRFPKPPTISKSTADYLYRSFDIEIADLTAVQLLAAEVGQPRISGLADFAMYNSFVDLISSEKYILAKLAAPMMPKTIFTELLSLFRWLTEIGWLGTLQAITLGGDAYVYAGSWYDKCLVLGTKWQNNIIVWDAQEVSGPQNTLKELWVQDLSSLFLPKSEFLSQLETLERWRVHASEQQLDNYIQDMGKATESLAQVTSLPSKAWQLLLSGAVSRAHFRSFSFAASVGKRLGTKTSTLNKLQAYINCLGSTERLLIAAAWHENFATNGPNISNLADVWQQEFGTPWIQLDESDIEFLAAVIDFPRMAIAAVNSKISVATTPEVFVFYVTLTQLVQPQSSAAEELVRRLEQFRNYQPSEDMISLTEHYPLARQPLVHAPRALTEGHLDRLIDYLKHGTAIDGHLQNPKLSAPNTVTEAAETLGVTEEAACYFLQILSLTRPTDQEVKTWNGWSTKQLQVVAQELIDKQLVLQAKRTGSGRSVFLAGGWLEKSNTGPAMEIWKAPHYLLWKDPKTRPIIPGCPPLLPYCELFAQTWQRYASGDKPRYEELRTTRYRRSR